VSVNTYAGDIKVVVTQVAIPIKSKANDIVNCRFYISEATAASEI
jgi:hypothetical protein